MKLEWFVKLCLCGLLSSFSLLILNSLVDDSFLICTRRSDRRVDCMIGQTNFLGQQHDTQEIGNLRMASLEFHQRSNSRPSSASRVLLSNAQGDKILLSSVYSSSASQPESAKIVVQVNQFLQSHESRMEVSVVYTPRFFLLLSIALLFLVPVIIKSKIKLKK